MLTEMTVNAIPFEESAERKWFLSSTPASPKQLLHITFKDGKTYKYAGTGKVEVGDPVVIDYGGATSYCFGNVSKIESGTNINKKNTLPSLFPFSKNPDKKDIKKNFDNMVGMDKIENVSGYFKYEDCEVNQDRFHPIDHLVKGVLNAITVIAFPELSDDEDTVTRAKMYLRKKRPIPSFVFSKKYVDKYYGYFFDILRLAEKAEVSLTGFYPGWKETINSFDFSPLEAADKTFEKTWDSKEKAFYLYFEWGSKKLKDAADSCKGFAEMTNELVFRSALSILIRGGFVNLLQAALSSEMPIKGFYNELISFADEIGSTECSKLLKSIDYENIVFEAPVLKNVVVAPKKEYEYDGTKLVKYKGKNEVVSIPEGTVIIGQNAFRKKDIIKKVIMPDSVKTIERCAFDLCSNLEEIVFSKQLSSIDEYVFAECISLKNVDLSMTKIRKLKNTVFYGCKELTEIKLPEKKRK